MAHFTILRSPRAYRAPLLAALVFTGACSSTGGTAPPGAQQLSGGGAAPVSTNVGAAGAIASGGTAGSTTAPIVAGAAGATTIAAAGAMTGTGGSAALAGAGGTVSTEAGMAGGATGGAMAGIGGAGMGGGDPVPAGGASDGAGGSPVLSAGGTSTGMPGCASAAICDDFEAGMNAAWLVQPDSNPAPEIDNAKGANGTSSSLKIVGTSQQSFIATTVPAQAFYVRARMNFEQSTAQMTGHGWFIVAATNLTSGNEQQMRFGSSSNHGHPEIDFNVYGPSCGGEKTQFSDGASDGLAGWNGNTFDSVLLDAGKWYCMEALFNGPGNEFQLWIDGAEVPGLHVTEQTMCANWSPTYTHIKFGAGANSSIGAIWYDDVAVSETRIGCN